MGLMVSSGSLSAIQRGRHRGLACDGPDRRRGHRGRGFPRVRGRQLDRCIRCNHRRPGLAGYDLAGAKLALDASETQVFALTSQTSTSDPELVSLDAATGDRVVGA